MDKIFKYSLLKYRPSSILDEQVNIGILFVFADDNQAIFVFPKTLTRLSALFPDTDLKDVKNYLLAFQNRAKKLSNHNLATESAVENWTEKAFLVADANSFFFSDFKVGVYGSIDNTVDYFKNQYFLYYNRKKNALKKTEPVV